MFDDRVIICGGRDYKTSSAIRAVIEQLPKSTIIITGGARGADRIADEIAKDLGYDRIICPANWTRDGKAAGPIRNRLMRALGPDAVYAFPGGKGTEDMIRLAEAAGITVHRVSAKP